jgi:hypothetical protein
MVEIALRIPLRGRASSMATIIPLRGRASSVATIIPLRGRGEQCGDHNSPPWEGRRGGAADLRILPRSRNGNAVFIMPLSRSIYGFAAIIPIGIPIGRLACSFGIDCQFTAIPERVLPDRGNVLMEVNLRIKRWVKDSRSIICK